MADCNEWVLVGSVMRHNSYHGQLRDKEKPIVWHEQILDEYWNQLDEAILSVVRHGKRSSFKRCIYPGCSDQANDTKFFCNRHIQTIIKKSNGRLCLAGAGALVDGAGDDSSHDDSDDKDIAQVRQLDIVTDIRNIHIENVEMKKERIAALVAIFCNGRDNDSSTDFNFINIIICGEGIKYLSNLVDVSSMLQSFSIRHNQIDNDVGSTCYLPRSLKSSSSIDNLSLAYCDLGNSPEILSVILKSDVRYINLDNNNIDSSGAVKIAEYLGSDPPIHCFDLKHNRLNDDYAMPISQALKWNSYLRHLDLLGNNFSSMV